MPFTIPDEAEAAFGAQSTLYQTDINALMAGNDFTGVLRGGAVTASSGMTLAVASGKMVEASQRFPINAGTVTVTTAHASNPRFDIVVAYYYGVNVVVAGTAGTTPLPPDVPDGAVLLAQVYVPANDTTIDANQIIDKRVMVADESEWAEELAYWHTALGSRLRRNANIWIVGDSMSEGFGAPSFDKTWKQLFRSAIQQPYRYGGAGFLPAQNYASLTADVTPGAPANAHLWTFTGGDSGIPDPGGSFGIGIGLRSKWMAVGGTATLVFYGDAIRVAAFSSTATGTLNVTVDGVAQTAFNTVGVAGPNTTKTALYSGFAIGWHTIVLTCATADCVLEGAHVYQGDIGAGVHVYDCARSGLLTAHFDTETTNGSAWMQVGHQPASRFASITGSLTASSTTLTDASGAFTTRDVGEWVVFADPTKVLYGAAKITAFLSSTTVTLDRAAFASGSSINYSIGRSEVATWSITSGSAQATSTTAAFTSIDEGKFVQGPAGIPANTQIYRVVNATTVLLTKTATATAGSQTARILNRETVHNSPDMMIIELGINDSSTGISISDYKTNLKAIGVGGNQRMAQDKCSVMLVGLWSPSYTSYNTGMSISTSNGSNIITLNNFPVSIFTASDVGKTVSLAGAPGTAPTGFAATVTISSIGATGQTAVVSANANSTQSASLAQIVGRQWSDQMWQPYRRAMREVAEEQGWLFIDLYDFGGYIGQVDPLGLTVDLLHPDERGNFWVADRFTKVLSGLPRTASLPAGLADVAGQMPVAIGLDTWKAAPGMKRKLTADSASGASAGVYVDITEWAFSIAPGETFDFICNLMFTAAAATSGILFRFNPGSGVSAAADICMGGWGPTSASAGAPFGAQGTAWASVVSTVTGSLGSTTVPTVVQITGGFTAGTAGGIITPQFAPEAAAAVTLQRGSFILLL
jgi:lysophospholipase L1-like esterase